ncbi:MAG: M14 family metallopeptidase [Inquilinaceae bacterium]
MDPNTYPIELDAPDIEPYRAGNTGVPYYTTFDSGRPGPHLLINALIHGNELCGAIALDFLFRNEVRPLLGRLTLGFANVVAYRAFDPARPMASRYLDEDMNRVWDPSTLDGDRRSRELDRAREIRPLIDRVDHLFDIHSMQHRTPPLMLAGPLAKGRSLAHALGFPADVVCDGGHSAGRRLRDYGPFGDSDAPNTALLIECGQHWEAAAAGVAIESVMRFLLHYGVIDPAIAAPHLTATLPPQRTIEVTQAVTVGSDRFIFAQPFTGMEVLPHAGDAIADDDGHPVVAPYDNCVLIMPSRRLSPGQTAVRLGRVVA